MRLPPVLTVPETAALLQLHCETVRRMVREGILARVVGVRPIRIPRTEVSRILKMSADAAKKEQDPTMVRTRRHKVGAGAKLGPSRAHTLQPVDPAGRQNQHAEHRSG